MTNKNKKLIYFIIKKKKKKILENTKIKSFSQSKINTQMHFENDQQDVLTTSNFQNDEILEEMPLLLKVKKTLSTLETKKIINSKS